MYLVAIVDDIYVEADNAWFYQFTGIENGKNRQCNKHTSICFLKVFFLTVRTTYMLF